MGGSGGGKLRGELGNHSIGGNRFEDGIALGITLEKTPAKAIYEKENHLVIGAAGGKIAKDIERKRWLLLAAEQPGNGDGQIREAVRVVAGSKKLLRKG